MTANVCSRRVFNSCVWHLPIIRKIIQKESFKMKKQNTHACIQDAHLVWKCDQNVADDDKTKKSTMKLIAREILTLNSSLPRKKIETHDHCIWSTRSETTGPLSGSFFIQKQNKSDVMKTHAESCA